MAGSDVLWIGDWIGDRLPTVYDVAQTILTIQTILRSKTISRYVDAVRDV